MRRKRESPGAWGDAFRAFILRAGARTVPLKGDLLYGDAEPGGAYLLATAVICLTTPIPSSVAFLTQSVLA